MGRTINSGLGIGLGNSPQGDIMQSNVDVKIKELIKNRELEELDKAGVKYNPGSVIFVTRDKTGQLIWLEKGNDSAGLMHILERHANDFAAEHRVSKDDVSNHIKHIITNGSVEYTRMMPRKNGVGIEKLYSYNGTYYMTAGIGTNGFIVSAYPVNEKVAKKLIERYKKYGKE